MSPGSPPASYECVREQDVEIEQRDDLETEGLREHLKHNGRNRQRSRKKAGSGPVRPLTTEGKHLDMKGSRKPLQGIERGVGI